MLGPFATRAAARPISRCRYRYCRGAPPAHRCPRRQRQRRQRDRGDRYGPMEWAQSRFTFFVCSTRARRSCGVFRRRGIRSFVFHSRISSQPIVTTELRPTLRRARLEAYTVTIAVCPRIFCGKFSIFNGTGFVYVSKQVSLIKHTCSYTMCKSRIDN